MNQEIIKFPQHLIGIESLDKTQIIAILDQAQAYIDTNQYKYPHNLFLKNKTVINLFFEPSTRTKCSFELAAKRLGAEVLNVDLVTSSVQKGETLIDTVRSLAAMHCDFLVVRHPESGACQTIAENLQSKTQVINAGDGTHQHPTQALLDLLTIRQHKKDFAKLSVAIVGDIAHSRVAHSNLRALKILEVPDIRIVGPKPFIPSNEELIKNVKVFHDLDMGLRDVDVVMLLRIQRERMHRNDIPDVQEYFLKYGLTRERLQYPKANAIIMHPGPINRDIEIASDVADGEQSVILQQVRNGVAIRMALMTLLAK